jgi:hypothetical protein
MMPAISIFLLAFLAQSNVVDRGVAEFHRGEYAAAKKDLEQNASDPQL